MFFIELIQFEILYSIILLTIKKACIKRNTVFLIAGEINRSGVETIITTPFICAFVIILKKKWYKNLVWVSLAIWKNQLPKP